MITACSIRSRVCAHTGKRITPPAEITRVRLWKPRRAPERVEAAVNVELFIPNDLLAGLGAPIVAPLFNIFHKAHLIPLH